MLFHAALQLGTITPALCDHHSSTGHPIVPCSTGKHYSSTGQPLVHYWAMLFHAALGNHYSSTGHPLVHCWAMSFHVALGNAIPALGIHYFIAGQCYSMQYCATLFHHWEPISPLLGNVIPCSTGQRYSSTGHPLVHCWAMLFHAALGNVIPALGNVIPALGHH